MTLMAKFVSYAAIICGLPLVFAGGIHWLVAADAHAPRALESPPLPPRIADSIERKKQPLPPPSPSVPPRSAVVTAPLRQATASLHPAPVPTTVRGPHRGVMKSRSAREAVKMPAIAAPAPQAVSTRLPQAVITTARSDVPY